MPAARRGGPGLVLDLACWIESDPHFMNLAVHDIKDRNAGHAHPLACGCPSAQLSGLRTSKRPTSRNTITLCNKVCDGEVNIREQLDSQQSILEEGPALAPKADLCGGLGISASGQKQTCKTAMSALPRKRTLIANFAMSAKGQKRTFSNILSDCLLLPQKRTLWMKRLRWISRPIGPSASSSCPGTPCGRSRTPHRRR
jgi:hypothetical protein